MALNFPQLTQTAMLAAKKAGATARATITRDPPPPNPMTGAQSGSAQTQTVDVIVANPHKFAYGDAQWTAVESSYFLSAMGASFPPLRGDRITLSGVSGRVTLLKPYTVTGAVLGWFLGVEA